MLEQSKMTGALTPQELRRRAEEKAMVEAKKAFDAMQKAEDQRRELHELFMSREVRPDGMERLMAAVSRAAEDGKSELMVIRFPSTYLSDGGRAVNNFEPSWPKTLEGFARRAFEFYDQHLRQHGYKLRAQVLEFPDGKPGDVGLFLCW
ncbi:MAG: hypothetical protein IRZ04_18760 [Rhodospirillales bacterium]|nr:hypothetical protein [Rhodospirillales bacterium]